VTKTKPDFDSNVFLEAGDTDHGLVIVAAIGQSHRLGVVVVEVRIANFALTFGFIGRGRRVVAFQSCARALVVLVAFLGITFGLFFLADGFIEEVEDRGQLFGVLLDHLGVGLVQQCDVQPASKRFDTLGFVFGFFLPTSHTVEHEKKNE
jgi:hypothetical protein